MQTPLLDPLRPEVAYLVGLAQTDGHLACNTQNRGRFSVELQAADDTLLKHLQEIVPVYSSISYRKRDTNFKKAYRSVVWTVCDLGFRTALNELGVPYGKKSRIVAPPSVPFSERDYFRGVIDGDGSLGYTGNGFPFLSLTTKSPALAAGYSGFVHRVTGKERTTAPNARDGMYNIVVFKEDAQAMARALYTGATIALPRKAAAADEIADWIRPAEMRLVTWERRPWAAEEDEIVRSVPPAEAAAKLGRTEKAVYIRRHRLTRGTAGHRDLNRPGRIVG